MDDCLFCKICKKEISSATLYEDDDVLAFEDIAPKAPVHFLVVPKRHIADANALSEADGALLGKLFACVARVAAEKGVAENGYRVVTNIGEDGGQSVDHLHFHVLGGRQLAWPPG